MPGEGLLVLAASGTGAGRCTCLSASRESLARRLGEGAVLRVQRAAGTAAAAWAALAGATTGAAAAGADAAVDAGAGTDADTGLAATAGRAPRAGSMEPAPRLALAVAGV